MLTEMEIHRRLRSVKNAVAQQKIEGQDVTPETIELMEKEARGEITMDEVIEALNKRYLRVPEVQQR